MNEYYVYRYIRLDTNTPFYVGKGKEKRAYKLNDRNRYFKNIIKTVPYELEFICEDMTEDRAFNKEIEFIKLYKDAGYCEANLSNGGEGPSGTIVSKETRAKLSALKAGSKHPQYGKPKSEETKAKLSFLLSGERSPN